MHTPKFAYLLVIIIVGSLIITYFEIQYATLQDKLLLLGK